MNSSIISFPLVSNIGCVATIAPHPLSNFEFKGRSFKNMLEIKLFTGMQGFMSFGQLLERTSSCLKLQDIQLNTEASCSHAFLKCIVICNSLVALGLGLLSFVCALKLLAYQCAKK